MMTVACAIPLFIIGLEKLSAFTKNTTYDPLVMFLIAFIVGSMLVATSFSIISYYSKKLAAILLSILTIAVGTLSVFLGVSPSSLLLYLSFIPVGIVISLCLVSEYEKAHTVVAAAAVLVSVLILSFLLAHYSAYGEVSSRSLTHFVSAVKQEFVSVTSEIDYESLGLSVTDISESFDSVIYMMPAIIIIFASVISYICVSLARVLLLGHGASSEGLKHWPLKMSRMASAVFLISFLIIMLSGAKSVNVTDTSALNLMLILTPGFFLIGIRSSVIHLRRSGFFGMIFMALIFFTTIKYPPLFLMIVAASGALDNLFPSFREALYGEISKSKN
jgi:hypothetical protein